MCRFPRHIGDTAACTLSIVLLLSIVSAPAGATVTETGDITFDSFGLKNIGDTSNASVDVFGNDPAATLASAVLGREAGSSGSLIIRQGSTARVLGVDILDGEIPPNVVAVENAIWVGFDGDGALSVIEGSVLNDIRGLPVGTRAGSTGHLIVDGPGSTINVSGHLGGDANALANGFVPEDAQGFVSIGPSGTGVMDITDGGVLNITQVLGKPTVPFGLGLVLGGEPTATGGGHGTVNVDGAGSEINITGINAFLMVGNLGGVNFDVGGTGELNVTSGAKVTVAGAGFLTEFAGIGAFAGTVGDAIIDGAGSSLDGGDSIGIGTNGTLFDFDATNDIAGGSGTLTVRNGASIEADFGVFIGQDGTLIGDGTVIGGITLDGGTIMPGNSPGDLTVIGNIDMSRGGTLVIEIDSDSVFDRIFSTGQFLFGGGEINFVFGAGVDPSLLEAIDFGQIFQSIDFAGDPNPSPGVVGVDLIGLDLAVLTGSSSSYEIDSIDFDPSTGFSVSATAVPLPPAILLFGSVCGLLASARRH